MPPLLTSLFMWVLGMEHRSLHLYVRHFINRATSSTPNLFFFFAFSYVCVSWHSCRGLGITRRCQFCSSAQAWQQRPLPTEPSCLPSQFIIFLFLIWESQYGAWTDLGLASARISGERHYSLLSDLISVCLSSHRGRQQQREGTVSQSQGGRAVAWTHGWQRDRRGSVWCFLWRQN